MIRPVCRDQGSHQRIGVVLAHPFASDGNPEAVTNDVYLLRASEGQDCAHERAHQRDRGGRRMGDARTPRLILQEIALIPLIAERPNFRNTQAMVDKKLTEVLNITKRVAGSSTP